MVKRKNYAKQKVAAKKVDIEDYLYILTNERTDMKANMLLMMYKAMSLNQLGYMDGMDPDTGEIVPLLVGFEPNPEGKFNVFPLARIFNKIEGIPHYLVPDGEGNYIDYRTPDQRDDGDSAGTEAKPERQEDRPPEEVGASSN